MKTIPAAVQAYFDAGGSYIESNMLWITTIAGSTFGFHDGPTDETITVVNPNGGADVARAYKGGGHIVNFPDLSDVPDLTIKSITIDLSGVSDDVKTMIDGNEMRGATIEWHLGFLDQDTMLLIETPECEFDGFINGINLTEAAIDPDTADAATANYAVSCVSHGRELTRTSSKTRSYRDGLERSGDEIFKYTGSVGRWKIRWGKGKASHDEKSDGKHIDPTRRETR